MATDHEEQWAQSPPEQPLQPEDEDAVVAPELSFEVKAKADTNRFRSLPLHFGQTSGVALDLTRSSNLSLH